MTQGIASWKGPTAALWLLVAALAGCNPSHRRFTDEPPDFRRFGALPALARSADPSLQDELARLQAEEGTPEQLAAREPPLSSEERADLRDRLSRGSVERLLEDFAKIYPTGRFTFSAPARQRAADLLKQEQPLIADAQETIAGFGRLPLDHNQGLLAEMHVVDVATLAHRAHGLAAAAALERGDLVGAEQEATRMLAIDGLLADAWHVVPRLAGARLRLESLRVIEAIVQDEAATRATLLHFHDLLAEQLDHWPPDAQAWIGDRAQGLHTYEMIRHGLVLSVFTDDELAALREQEGVTATAKAIAQNVDADQRFYLTTMREIIDACERPFHARRELLLRITRHLQEDRNSPTFPLVAGRILLVDLEPGHRWQAVDRAACEGWLLALAHATGGPPPPYTHNPQTGLPYEVSTDTTRVLVRHARAGEPDEAIIVPKR